MTPGIRPLVAGNWKMNGLKANGGELRTMMEGLVAPLPERVDVMVCPPATLILAFAAMAEDSAIAIGGQDCHTEASGPHTGDISAEMLADAGARAVIVGHSERRTGHDETDDIVRAKVHAAWRAGLVAIVCVGETESERKDGEALATVGAQLDVSVPDQATADWLAVAYEPVWAIGTGVTPGAAEVGEMHGFIRERLGARFGVEGATTRILYGGSAKPENAAELMAVTDVDGALVGGASLKAADFLQIAAACAHMAR